MAVPFLKSEIKGSGQPLILLHAFPLSHFMWENLKLQGFQCIFPDFPGFGSSPIASGMNLEDAAHGLRKHLEEIGVTQPIILGGISMGGYWVMEFFRQYPDLVKGLILISTRAGLDKPEARQRRLNTAERVEKEGTGFLVEAMVPSLLGQTSLGKNPKLVQEVSDWIRGASALGIAAAQRTMANRRSQMDLLTKIKVKTLILAGLEDTLIPSQESETMAKAIGGSQLTLFPEAGHLIPLESPSEFQKCLDAFLNTYASQELI